MLPTRFGAHKRFEVTAHETKALSWFEWSVGEAISLPTIDASMYYEWQLVVVASADGGVGDIDGTTFLLTPTVHAMSVGASTLTIDNATINADVVPFDGAVVVGVALYKVSPAKRTPLRWASIKTRCYGAHCGSCGRRDSSATPEPIDELDAACKAATAMVPMSSTTTTTNLPSLAALLRVVCVSDECALWRYEAIANMAMCDDALHWPAVLRPASDVEASAVYDALLDVIAAIDKRPQRSLFGTGFGLLTRSSAVGLSLVTAQRVADLALIDSGNGEPPPPESRLGAYFATRGYPVGRQIITMIVFH